MDSTGYGVGHAAKYVPEIVGALRILGRPRGLPCARSKATRAHRPSQRRSLACLRPVHCSLSGPDHSPVRSGRRGMPCYLERV